MDFSPLTQEVCSLVFSFRQSRSTLSLVAVSSHNLWLTTEPLEQRLKIISCGGCQQFHLSYSTVISVEVVFAQKYDNV
mgnify:CR=1 FL=1